MGERNTPQDTGEQRPDIEDTIELTAAEVAAFGLIGFQPNRTKNRVIGNYPASHSVEEPDRQPPQTYQG